MEGVTEHTDNGVVPRNLGFALCARVEMLGVIGEHGATLTLGWEVLHWGEAQTVLNGEKKVLIDHRELGRCRKDSQPRACVGR